MAKGDYVGWNRGAYTIRWDEELRARIKILSIRRGERLSDTVEAALREWADYQEAKLSQSKTDA